MPDLDIAQDALLLGEEFVLDPHMSNNMETLLDSGHQPLVCPHLSDPPLYSDIPECVLTPPPASQSVPVNDIRCDKKANFLNIILKCFIPTPIEGEVLHMDTVEEVEEVEEAEEVEEEDISKLTVNRRLKAKVGKFKHSLLSLLPKRKILPRFLTRVRQLNILQTKTLSKVNYVIFKDN